MERFDLPGKNEVVLRGTSQELEIVYRGLKALDTLIRVVSVGGAAERDDRPDVIVPHDRTQPVARLEDIVKTIGNNHPVADIQLKVTPLELTD